MKTEETIVALATPPGTGAIAVIRLSGPEALAITSRMFVSVSGKVLAAQPTHTIHLGHIQEGEKVIDEVLASVFKNPNSYTGEDVVEFSCHGSNYIQQEIIQLALKLGCRTAQPGEFTLRAFLNGKMDLSQAEAVADLIASDSEAAHQLAISQMRGGFSQDISKLRQELLNFASLIELELDFSEEDVEFANRDEFRALLLRIKAVLKKLIDSFATGNVFKVGIPVAIAGEPNVGKSTLLNALLNEERAIVSDIAGTTRDTVEDEITIGGISFRFIDTAGIRETDDLVEGLGIQKTFEKIEQAKVVLFLAEAPRFKDDLGLLKTELGIIRNKYPQKILLVLLNKSDLIDDTARTLLLDTLNEFTEEDHHAKSLLISAKTGEGITELHDLLLDLVNAGALRSDETLVSNARHYDSLTKALEEIDKVQQGLDADLSGDLLAIDIRQALYHLGEITGEVTNDELLGNIFANFCIGK